MTNSISGGFLKIVGSYLQAIEGKRTTNQIPEVSNLLYGKKSELPLLIKQNLKNSSLLVVGSTRYVPLVRNACPDLPVQMR